MKIKTKSIKKTFTILSFCLAGILIIFASAPILLKFSKVQNFVAQIVVKEVSDKLQTKVEMGEVEYLLFNSLIINDLYIEDQQKDSLLYIEQLNTNFNFFDLFKGNVIVNSLELKQLNGKVKINKLGKSNLQFIINALKTPKKGTSKVVYKITDFKITNSSLSYHDLRNLKVLPKNTFNPANFVLSNLNASFSVPIIKKDTMNIVLSSLSFKEKSGFFLKNLTTNIIQSSKSIVLPNLNIELANSKFDLKDIEFKTDTTIQLNTLLTSSKWQAPIAYSQVSFVDLSPLIPELKNIKGKFSIDGEVSGQQSSIRFQKMNIAYGKNFELNADLDINGFNNINDAFIYCNINNLKMDRNVAQDFIAQLTKKPFILPKELNQLGSINYTGNVTGFFSNLVAYGNVKTDLGSISTDILLKFDKTLKDLTYKGTLQTKGFQAGKLLNNKMFGNISLKINTEGTKLHNAPFKGIANAIVPEFEVNNYLYKDLKFDGKYDGTGFDGFVNIKDENIDANFKGLIDLTQQLPIYDFDLKVQHVNPRALHFIQNYPNSSVSFAAKMNMVGKSFDDINGYIRFDSVQLTNNNKVLNVDMIKFNSTTSKNYTDFKITSDFVNGSFSGNFNYSTIGKTINSILQNYLPSLANSKTRAVDKNRNNIFIDLTIQNTNEITDVFNLPYTIEGKTTIKGKVDELTDVISIEGIIPSLKTSKQYFENISLRLDNSQKTLRLNSRGQLHDKLGIINLYLNSTALNDSILTRFGWQNLQATTNAGELNTSTKLSRSNNKLTANMLVQPTEIIINDSVWNIRKCNISFTPDSSIQVQNFAFENSKQFIHVNGKISKKPSDNLTVQMNDIDLDYLMRIIKLKGISIGGFITGNATFSNLMDKPVYEAKLNVRKALLNNKSVGNLRVESTWDAINKNVLINGDFYDDNNNTTGLAKGIFNPKSDSIDVKFDVSDMSIEFLSRYFEGVVSDVRGNCSGKVRMFGPTKYIKFEGDLLAKNASMKVDVLQTTYHFTDSVQLRTHSIRMKNITIYDEDNNKGSLDGIVKHNGMFLKMNYNIDISGKNLLAMNTKAEDNSYFYGKAYVNGMVNIVGDEKLANIFISATTLPKTKCYVQMDGSSSASDNSFINFVKKNETNEPVKKQNSSTTTKMNVNVDMKIDVTPDAEMNLIVDSKAGDMISAFGNGNLRVQFDLFSDINLWGTYTIERGKYLFTLQTLIRKDFKIERGSTMSWTGDAFKGKMNINALYSVNASLSDLMDEAELETITTRTNVPVNCVLKLTEDLMAPTIKFDIDLPSSDESTKQKVKSIINTEEMMNRQIAYLLLLNKFFTPDYLRTSPLLGVNEGLSFATSTLSAHVNNWLKQSLNSNNLSVGFDWQKSETVSDEFQAQVLYQPNKRLIVNGNFGYRYDNTSTNTNKFVGDFDIEYILTEAGNIRLKAYSHTIDRAQLREAKATRGVGFGYKENFDSLSEMFTYYWGKMKSLFEKKK